MARPPYGGCGPAGGSVLQIWRIFVFAVAFNKLYATFARIVDRYTAYEMAADEKNSDIAHTVPETELANVVMHAAETSDVTYLKDYIQVIFWTFG